MDLSTALAILGLQDNCNAREMRDAYLDLVKVWHPDRFPPNSRLRTKAEEKLKEINEAYALLSEAIPPTQPRRTQTHPPPSPPGTASRAGHGQRSSPSVVAYLVGRWVGLSTGARWLYAIGAIWIGLLGFESLAPKLAEPVTTTPPVQTAAAQAAEQLNPVPSTVPESSVSRQGASARSAPTIEPNRKEAEPCDPPPLGLLDEADLILDDVSAPRSGTEIGGVHKGGLGSLRIKNGSESDAIAVVLDGITREPKRAIYIRRGEAGVMTSMPVGTYRVRFQLGQQWLRSRRFCRISGTSEFEDALDFKERDTGNSTEYSQFELTLYAVVDGNARTDSLPNTPLALPNP